MSALSKFYKVFDKLVMALAFLSGVFILIMMFRTTADILLRNLFRISFSGTYENSQYIYMPLCVLPSLAYIYKSGILPKLDVISKPKNPNTAKLLLIVLALVEGIIFIMLAFYSFKSAGMAIDDMVSIRAGGKQVPTWPVYLFCPVGFVTLAIESITTNIILIMGGNPEEILSKKTKERTSGNE